jgi:hypothetical protein
VGADHVFQYARRLSVCLRVSVRGTDKSECRGLGLDKGHLGARPGRGEPDTIVEQRRQDIEHGRAQTTVVVPGDDWQQCRASEKQFWWRT